MMTEQLDEKQILDRLFDAEANVPEKDVTIKRTGLTFTIKALKEGRVEQLEKQYTTQKKVRGREVPELDRQRFYRSLITEATTAIGGNESVRWDHAQLLKKYEASSAEQVLKRVLLSGEIALLADEVMGLSGYYEDTESSDIKNSSKNEG